MNSFVTLVEIDSQLIHYRSLKEGQTAELSELLVSCGIFAQAPSMELIFAKEVLNDNDPVYVGEVVLKLEEEVAYRGVRVAEDHPVKAGEVYVTSGNYSQPSVPTWCSGESAGQIDFKIQQLSSTVMEVILTPDALSAMSQERLSVFEAPEHLLHPLQNRPVGVTARQHRMIETIVEDECFGIFKAYRHECDETNPTACEQAAIYLGKLPQQKEVEGVDFGIALDCGTVIFGNEGGAIWGEVTPEAIEACLDLSEAECEARVALAGLRYRIRNQAYGSMNPIKVA